jgi:hypothetical protein
MTRLFGLGILPLVAVLAAGCSGNEDDASSDTQNLTFGSSPQMFDHDIVIPPQSFPISHTFQETLSKFGVSVTPSFTPSGTFTLKDADVHIQAQYVANPPSIKRLDVMSRGTWGVTARLDVDVKAGADWKTSADFRKQFSVGTSLGGKAFELAKIPIAAIPLPQAPNIFLHLDLELAAACELEFDAELHAFAEIGVGGLASADTFYVADAPKGKNVGFVANGGLTTADQFHITVPPHVEFKDGNLAQVMGKCGVQPSVNVTASIGPDPAHSIADLGVKLVVQPYAQFDGKFNSPTDWSVDAKTGIEATVSPFGDFFGQPFSTTADLKLFDFELARGPSSSSSGTPAATADATPPDPSQ